MLVLEVVTDALRRRGVIGESASPTAEQGQDAVRKLNDLMARLAEKGIDLGYNPKASTADTIILPIGHLLGIKAMLARDLEYGGLPVTPDIENDAQDTEDRLLRQALNNAFSADLRAMPLGRGVFDITTGTWR